MSEITPPPKVTPIQRPDGLDEAIQAVEEAEAAEDDSALVINGVYIYPLRVTGLDKQRIRIATDGYISATADLMQLAMSGDLEAIAALFYVFRLKQDETTPKDAPYTYEECLDEIDVEQLADVMKQMYAAQEADG